MFIVSFTPTEKYVDYYDKIIITDGKATPSTIEIPVHLYSTGFNQTLNGFSLPATCLTTDEVEMPVVTANTGLTPVEFLSSDSAIAYVENNVLKILKAGSVDIIAYQAGDDRYNEVSETKTIDIQLAPSTILQAPEALMIAVGSELSVSTLRNGQADVEGTFAWADGSEVLTTAGDFEREVIFVPSADTIYAPASVMVTVSVTDGAAITEYPTLSDIVYGQELWKIKHLSMVQHKTCATTPLNVRSQLHMTPMVVTAPRPMLPLRIALADGQQVRQAQ